VEGNILYAFLPFAPISLTQSFSVILWPRAHS
jgi:hypothetical protein